MSALPNPVLDESVALADGLKAAMRRLASGVSIITSRDEQGQPHGMAASAVIPVAMDPPSMLIAVNRDAGLHSVLGRSGRYCINLLADHQQHLLLPFSKTALREQRFSSGDWHSARAPAGGELPWLAGACAVIDCEVVQAVDYGTHTLFIGRVSGVRCDTAVLGHASATPAAPAPLVWLAGRPVRLAGD